MAFQVDASFKIWAPSAQNMSDVKTQIERGVNPNVSVKIDINRASLSQVSNKAKSAFGSISVPISVNVSGNGLRAVKEAADSQSFKKLQTELGKIDEKFKELEKARTAKHIHAMSESMEEFGIRSSVALKRFLAFTVATVGIIKVTQLFKQSFDEAVKFEDAMTKIAQVTERPLQGLSRFRKETLETGRQFGTSSNDIAQGALIIAQAGKPLSEVRAAMEAIAKANVSPTFGSAAESAEALVAVTSQFNEEAGKYEDILSRINFISAREAVESKDLVSAVQKAGGAFQIAGSNLNEFLSIITAVRATTRESADEISTGLRTVVARISRPETIDFFRKELKVDIAPGDRVDDVLTAIGKIRTALKETGDLPVLTGKKIIDPTTGEELNELSNKTVRFARVLEELGGIRQQSRTIPLLTQFGKIEGLVNSFEEIDPTTGIKKSLQSLDKDSQTAQQSLQRELERTKQAFLAVGDEFVSNPSTRRMIEDFLQLSRYIADVTKEVIKLTPMLYVLYPSISRGIFSVFEGFRPLSGARQIDLAQNRLQKRAVGGEIFGNQPGDSVPCMLTPGEVVLNKNQQANIGRILGRPSRQLFAEAGVPGFASGGSLGQSYPGNLNRRLSNMSRQFTMGDVDTYDSEKIYSGGQYNAKDRKIYINNEINTKHGDTPEQTVRHESAHYLDHKFGVENVFGGVFPEKFDKSHMASYQVGTPQNTIAKRGQKFLKRYIQKFRPELLDSDGEYQNMEVRVNLSHPSLLHEVLPLSIEDINDPIKFQNAARGMGNRNAYIRGYRNHIVDLFSRAGVNVGKRRHGLFATGGEIPQYARGTTNVDVTEKFKEYKFGKEDARKFLIENLGDKKKQSRYLKLHKSEKGFYERDAYSVNRSKLKYMDNVSELSIRQQAQILGIDQNLLDVEKKTIYTSGTGGLYDPNKKSITIILKDGAKYIKSLNHENIHRLDHDMGATFPNDIEDVKALKDVKAEHWSSNLRKKIDSAKDFLYRNKRLASTNKKRFISDDYSDYLESDLEMLAHSLEGVSDPASVQKGLTGDLPGRVYRRGIRNAIARKLGLRERPQFFANGGPVDFKRPKVPYSELKTLNEDMRVVDTRGRTVYKSEGVRGRVLSSMLSRSLDYDDALRYGPNAGSNNQSSLPFLGDYDEYSLRKKRSQFSFGFPKTLQSHSQDFNDIAQHIPDDSKYSGHGQEGFAWKTPDGKVVRIQKGESGRPNAPIMLQPEFAAKNKTFSIEHLPFAEGVGQWKDYLYKGQKRGGFPSDIIQGAIQEQGLSEYKIVDLHDKNAGFIGGKPIVIDPGAIKVRKTKKGPRDIDWSDYQFASGGEIPQYARGTSGVQRGVFRPGEQFYGSAKRRYFQRQGIPFGNVKSGGPYQYNDADFSNEYYERMFSNPLKAYPTNNLKFARATYRGKNLYNYSPSKTSKFDRLGNINAISSEEIDKIEDPGQSRLFRKTGGNRRVVPLVNHLGKEEISLLGKMTRESLTAEDLFSNRGTVSRIRETLRSNSDLYQRESGNDTFDRLNKSIVAYSSDKRHFNEVEYEKLLKPLSYQDKVTAKDIKTTTADINSYIQDREYHDQNFVRSKTLEKRGRIQKLLTDAALPGNIITYSGLDEKSANIVYGTGVGEKFVLPRFLSTSVSRLTAQGFAGSRGVNGKPVVLKIRNYGGQIGQRVGGDDGEQEIFLPNNQQFQVLKINENKRFLEYYVDRLAKGGKIKGFAGGAKVQSDDDVFQIIRNLSGLYGVNNADIIKNIFASTPKELRKRTGIDVRGSFHAKTKSLRYIPGKSGEDVIHHEFLHGLDKYFGELYGVVGYSSEEPGTPFYNIAQKYRETRTKKLESLGKSSDYIKNRTTNKELIVQFLLEQDEKSRQFYIDLQSQYIGREKPHPISRLKKGEGTPNYTNFTANEYPTVSGLPNIGYNAPSYLFGVKYNPEVKDRPPIKTEEPQTSLPSFKGFTGKGLPNIKNSFSAKLPSFIHEADPIQELPYIEHKDFTGKLPDAQKNEFVQKERGVRYGESSRELEKLGLKRGLYDEDIAFDFIMENNDVQSSMKKIIRLQELAERTGRKNYNVSSTSYAKVEPRSIGKLSNLFSSIKTKAPGFFDSLLYGPERKGLTKSQLADVGKYKYVDALGNFSLRGFSGEKYGFERRNMGGCIQKYAHGGVVFNSVPPQWIDNEDGTSTKIDGTELLDLSQMYSFAIEDLNNFRRDDYADYDKNGMKYKRYHHSAKVYGYNGQIRELSNPFVSGQYDHKTGDIFLSDYDSISTGGWVSELSKRSMRHEIAHYHDFNNEIVGALSEIGRSVFDKKIARSAHFIDRYSRLREKHGRPIPEDKKLYLSDPTEILAFSAEQYERPDKFFDVVNLKAPQKVYTRGVKNAIRNLLRGYQSPINSDFGRVIQFAHGGTVPGTGTGDTIPALLSPGEVVLNKRQQRKIDEVTGSAAHLFKKAGVPGFQTGGAVKGIVESAKGVLSGPGGFVAFQLLAPQLAALDEQMGGLGRTFAAFGTIVAAMKVGLQNNDKLTGFRNELEKVNLDFGKAAETLDTLGDPLKKLKGEARPIDDRLKEINKEKAGLKAIISPKDPNVRGTGTIEDYARFSELEQEQSRLLTQRAEKTREIGKIVRSDEFKNAQIASRAANERRAQLDRAIERQETFNKRLLITSAIVGGIGTGINKWGESQIQSAKIFDRDEMRAGKNKQIIGTALQLGATGAVLGAQYGGPKGAIIGGIAGLGLGAYYGISEGQRQISEKMDGKIAEILDQSKANAGSLGPDKVGDFLKAIDAKYNLNSSETRNISGFGYGESNDAIYSFVGLSNSAYFNEGTTNRRGNVNSDLLVQDMRRYDNTNSTLGFRGIVNSLYGIKGDIQTAPGELLKDTSVGSEGGKYFKDEKRAEEISTFLNSESKKFINAGAFEKAMGPALRELADASNIPLEMINLRYKNKIEGLEEGVGKAVAETVKAFDNMANNIDKFTSAITSNFERINRLSTIPTLLGQSVRVQAAPLQTPKSREELVGFAQDVRVGSAGFGAFGKQLGSDLVNLTSSQIEYQSLINDLKNRGARKDEFVSESKNFIDRQNLSEDIKKQLVEKVRTGIDENKDFNSNFIRPSNLAEDVFKDPQSLLKPVNEQMSKITAEATNKLLELADAMQELRAKSTELRRGFDSVNQSIDLRVLTREISQSKSLELRGQNEEARNKDITGGRSAAELGKAISDFDASIIKKQQDLNTKGLGPQDRQDLIDKITQEQEARAKATKGLEFLVQNTDRLTVSQQKLQEMENQRLAKRNLLETLAFGSAEDKVAARRDLRNLQSGNLSQSARRNVISRLSGLPDDFDLSAFGVQGTARSVRERLGREGVERAGLPFSPEFIDSAYSGGKEFEAEAKKAQGLIDEQRNAADVLANVFEQRVINGFQQGVDQFRAAVKEMPVPQEPQKQIGNAAGFATGGIVPGFGHSDSVPTMLTPGEMILNKAQQKKLGLDKSIFAMGGDGYHFANGGVVNYRYNNYRRQKDMEDDINSFLENEDRILSGSVRNRTYNSSGPVYGSGYTPKNRTAYKEKAVPKVQPVFSGYAKTQDDVKKGIPQAPVSSIPVFSGYSDEEKAAKKEANRIKAAQIIQEAKARRQNVVPEFRGYSQRPSNLLKIGKGTPTGKNGYISFGGKYAKPIVEDERPEGAEHYEELAHKKWQEKIDRMYRRGYYQQRQIKIREKEWEDEFRRKSEEKRLYEQEQARIKNRPLSERNADVIARSIIERKNSLINQYSPKDTRQRLSQGSMREIFSPAITGAWGQRLLDTTSPSELAIMTGPAFKDWVLRLNQGGIVGGVGSVDKIPAMLTPGEAVLTRNQQKAIGNELGASQVLREFEKFFKEFRPENVVVRAEKVVLDGESGVKKIEGSVKLEGKMEMAININAPGFEQMGEALKKDIMDKINRQVVDLLKRNGVPVDRPVA